MVFQQIVFYIICVAGTVLLGTPIAALLRNTNENRHDQLPLSVIMGCFLTVLPVYWLSMLGLSMKIIVYVLLFCDLILWGLAIRKKRLHCPEKKDVLLLVICLVAGATALIPMVIHHGSYPYADGYTYVSIADYLLENGYSKVAELDQYHPWTTQIHLYQTLGFRIGAQLNLSFWTALFLQHYSILVYAPVSGLGICLFGAGVWYFLAGRAGIGRRRITFAIVFSAFNVSIIYWVAVIGFLPQLFGMGLLCAALRSVMEAISIRKVKKYIEAASMTAALCLCYSEIVPFFVLMILMLFFLYGYRCKTWGSLFRGLVVTAVLSAVIQAKYFVDMIRALIVQFGAVVGGDQSLDWFSSMSWLLSSAPVQYHFNQQSIQQIVYICLSLFLLISLLIGWRKSDFGSKKEFLTDGFAVAVPFFIFLVYFEYIAVNPFGTGVGNSWSVYKLIQYFAVIPFCYFFIYYADTFYGTGVIRKTLSMLLLSAFVILSICFAVQYSYGITQSMRTFTGANNPISEYIELAERYKGEERILNLSDMPVQQRKILTYFLRNNRLASDWSSDDYFSIYGGKMDPPFAVDGILLRNDPASTDSLAGVVETTASNYIEIKELDGVGTLERDDCETWSWNAVDSCYEIKNYTDEDLITLNFQLSSMDSDGDCYVDVYVNDKHQLRQEVNNYEKTPVTIQIPVGFEEQAKISLRYTGDTMMEPGGNRELVLCVWNIRANVPVVCE